MPINDESMLDSIKKVLGLTPDYDVFDADILMHMNSTFSQLHQLGIGPEEGFYLETADTKWEAYFAGSVVDPKQLSNVKTYVYIKVRLIFDPPATSFAIKALQDQAVELEWRLNATVDPPHATE